jgi:hypothetical protein
MKLRNSILFLASALMALPIFAGSGKHIPPVG